MSSVIARSGRAAALGLLVLLSACAPPVPPEQVASQFWAATLTDDRQALESLVLPGSLEAGAFTTARHDEIFDAAIIGQSRVADESAFVQTRLEGVFYGEPGDVVFDTVARLEQGQWRIDYQATASEMIGALLTDSVEEAGLEIREKLRIPEESLSESIREDLKTLQR